MATSRPEIFVSAVTADLGTCRPVVKEALLTMGCNPVEQANFPPHAGQVREMLRGKIAGCQAVVHIVGEAFGSEPVERGEGEPRRSYTQLEYDIARELGKPVYVFVCVNGFLFDTHDPEDGERVRLQEFHRTALTSSDDLYTPVQSRDELEKKVLALQIRIEVLEAELAHSRHELNDVRKQVTAFADAYTRLQRELQESRLTPEQIAERALVDVAGRVGIAVQELRKLFDHFVQAVRSDPTAPFIDRALADFAERRFASASENAGKAAAEAQTKRLAAEALAQHASAEADAARDREREARMLQGRSLDADRRFGEAVEAFEQAFAFTIRESTPEIWALIQFEIGNSASIWASVSEGRNIADRRSRAVLAYRAALEVRTRDAMPQQWAMTQNNLAIALSDQASASEGNERTRLLGEAVEAYRAAMEVYTRAALPQQWATTQNNLANALSDQASASEGDERTRLLGEVVEAYRTALEVRTRDAMPQQWAMTQNNLAIALRNQASALEGDERTRLLGEAVEAYRAALEVRTRDAMPQDWASTQNNLANALSDQASASEGDEKARLLGEAVEAHRAALEVRTRAALPQQWADSNNNLALALFDQSTMFEGEERTRLLQEAALAMQARGEVYTAEIDPSGFAAREAWIAGLEADIERLRNLG